MVVENHAIIPDLSKFELLDENNYKRWSKKLLELFKDLEIDYVLIDGLPANEIDSLTTTVATTPIARTMKIDEEARKKLEKDNKIARGHLLMHMSNRLFDLFVNYKSAKEIWDTLQKRYAWKKKFVVGNWLHFQMVDDKPIMEQVHEYENLVADVLNEGMYMCEVLQADVLLEKLPPSWSDYCNRLKHKERDFSLPDLITHMKMEEANRVKDKKISYFDSSLSTNDVW